jgi:hypothetical protein
MANYACTKKDEYLGLVVMAAGGQTSAFEQELVRATQADECTTFQAGETVQVLSTETTDPDPLLNGQRASYVEVSFPAQGSRTWWTTPAAIQ